LDNKPTLTAKEKKQGKNRETKNNVEPLVGWLMWQVAEEKKNCFVSKGIMLHIIFPQKEKTLLLLPLIYYYF
jgi:hypothetical protein